MVPDSHSALPAPVNANPERIVGAVLAALAGCFYLWHTGPHSFWLDSAEFVTTGYGAGIAHPPGMPLYVILTALAARLPLGGVVYRVHLLNVLLGAGAVWLVFAVGMQVLKRSAMETWPAIVAAGAMALAALFNPGLWFHAVRAEVYALNVVLCLAIVWLTLAWEDNPERAGPLMLIALLGGLGLANHHLLTGLTGLVCLGYAVSNPGMRRRLWSRQLMVAVVLGLGGLLTYLYLPIRSLQGWRMWGDAATPGGFLEMVSARAFHSSVTDSPVAPLPVALAEIVASWLDLMGVPLMVVGVLGLLLLVAQRRRVAGLLVALALAGALSKAIMYLDVENPDDHAYFLIGMLALTVAGVGLSTVALWLRVQGRVASWTGCGLLVVVMLANSSLLYQGNRHWCDLAHFQGPDSINRHFHERLPPDALFMPSYYATFFNHLLFRTVEQRRPDVTMVHQSLYSKFAGGKAYAADVIARHPETEALFQDFLATGNFPLEALKKLARSREILLENDSVRVTEDIPYLKPFSLGEGGLPIAAGDLAFDGPGVLYNVPPRIGWDEGKIQSRFWTDFYQDLSTVGVVHPELARLLLWYHYRNALYFVNRRAPRRALLEVKLARQLKPDFERLQDFETLLVSPPTK
jgi:hypothetical protein